jgi:hypothetical protein
VGTSDTCQLHVQGLYTRPCVPSHAPELVLGNDGWVLHGAWCMVQRLALCRGERCCRTQPGIRITASATITQPNRCTAHMAAITPNRGTARVRARHSGTARRDHHQRRRRTVVSPPYRDLAGAAAAAAAAAAALGGPRRAFILNVQLYTFVTHPPTLFSLSLPHRSQARAAVGALM